jgi:flagellar hook-length control protein FliK
MSNNSAYNNFLLKPIQAQPAPTQATPAPKRNDRDDHAASFQQSFKDLHERVHAQDEKIAKPAPIKKVARADNHKPANDLEKKSLVPAKHADKNTPRYQIAEKNKSTENSESKANQNSDRQGSPAEKTEIKSTAKKAATDEESPAGSLVTAVLPTNTNLPVSLSVFSSEVVPVSTEVDAQVETSDEFSIEVLSSDAVDGSDVSIGGTIKGGVPSSTSTTQAKTNKQNLDADGAPIAADVAAIIPQPLAQPQLPQAAALAPSPDVIAEQAPAVLAAVGSGVFPSPTLTQSASINADSKDESKVSETDALSALTDSPGGEKLSAKTVANDPSIAANPEAVASQAQVLDSKSAFEKTLQNLIHPESNARDDNAALPAAAQTSSISSTNTNTLDSMLRFNDSQTPAARSFVVQTAVPVPVGQPQWSQAVGEKVLWLAAQNVSSAEIHLNPENLGPVQVKVSVNQEQMTVNFTSHHAAVREVLDQNLGRLRDMFSEQGLNLVNVDVSDKSFSRQQGDAKDPKGQATNNDLNIDDETQVAISTIVQQRLVDHYA